MLQPMLSAFPVPKYHRVYLVLHEQLRDGRFHLGVPPETALMQQFGVARVTVRKALERLSDEGLIKREPGRGTHPVVQKRAPLTGLLENLVTMGMDTSVKVVSADFIQAPDEIANALHLNAANLKVQKAVRVRSTKEGPISLITTYVPHSIAKHFGKRELAKKPILVLIEEAGVKVGRAEQNISACLADSVAAEHLSVEIGSALLTVKRKVYNSQDEPIQWLHGLYRPDRYEYAMALSRMGDIDAKVWVSRNF
jgi:GntR family transcriptional regulator